MSHEPGHGAHMDLPGCSAKARIGELKQQVEFAKKEIQSLQQKVAELKSSKSVVDGIYEDRVNDNLELCSALRAVYSLCGEDPEIEKIVHTAIKEHGISDC